MNMQLTIESFRYWAKTNNWLHVTSGDMIGIEYQTWVTPTGMVVIVQNKDGQIPDIVQYTTAED